MYAVRERKCTGCGTVIKGRFPPVKDVYCITCNLANAARAAMEMANKHGPAYDRWLESRGPQGRPRRK